MAFNSLHYFLFLPAVFILFYLVRDRFRWIVLLLASFGFYASLLAPLTLVALVIVSTITYFFGIQIGRSGEDDRKKKLLWGGIGANIIILIIMKYLPFLCTNLNSLIGILSTHSGIPSVPVIVSVGVSYYTFQAISYLSDIYLEIEKPETHFGYFALYLAFFPKLFQGPIERSGSLLPELKKEYLFRYCDVREGLMLLLFGLFKKVVIADRLALFVDPVYNNVNQYTGGQMLLATYFYAFQIFFDFSGYTDMALGTARLFGVGLTQNFDNPYCSKSVAEFWRRWHISFSRWILLYIFQPLQMQLRYWKSGTVISLIVTFLISGIWHGATWGFVIWGLLHGIYLSVSTYFQPVRKKFIKKYLGSKTEIVDAVSLVVTFHLVAFAWIFFRANSVSDAFLIVAKIFSEPLKGYSLFWFKKEMELVVLFSCSSVFLIAFVARRKCVNFFKLPFGFRWATYLGMVLITMLFNMSSKSTFIYFQF